MLDQETRVLMPEHVVYPFDTLSDYLEVGLRLVFVGINPGLYSVRQGHYFARRTSRFWPAFSRSRLSADARIRLGRDLLGPEDDARLLAVGIGFTDVVKLPSRNVAELQATAFAEGAPALLERLARYRPAVACFHGVTGYRAVLRHGFGERDTGVELGPQARTLGPTRLFVAPNPSPANAHYRLEDQVTWYDRLADFLDAVAPRSPAP